MRVLVPDLPSFRELVVPGVELLFYSRDELPREAAAGLVLWLAGAERREQLVHLKGLGWILTLTAGVDGISPPDGVALYRAPDLHHQSVAVHAVAGMLAAMRGLCSPAPVSVLRSPLTTPRGKKIVLWGYGQIGREIERLLQPFGASVYGISSRTEPDLLEYRLAEADWVVLSLPLTPATQAIVNAATLAQLKPGAWLCNVGRGALVVTADLLAALTSGHLGGAVLDVADPEPLPSDHPLRALPNVILTPHTAGLTDDLAVRAAAYARHFLLELSQGRQPDGLVTAKGY